MDLGERTGKMARSNLSELPNTTFTVMTRWVSNGMHVVLATKQLHYSYTNMMHWEELVDFMDKNGGSKDPFSITIMFKCTLEKAELVSEYVGLYKHGQMVKDPIYGQILYNSCLSNTLS
jgi:hypothetical protein